MKRFLSALALIAAIFATPASAALAIVQVASGSLASGTGIPGSPVLTSTPTVGNLLVIFLHTDSATTGVTLNTSAYSQLANSITTKTALDNVYIEYRYVQSGDTTTLPAMATAGSYHWAYVAYEISGVTGNIAKDLQTVGSGSYVTGGYSTIYPLIVQQIPQAGTTLALVSGSNYGDTTAPSAPSGWTSDVSTGNQTNWGSLAAFHYATPSAGSAIGGAVLHMAGVAQLILQSAAPTYPYVRQQFTNQFQLAALNTIGVLQTAPISGNLDIAIIGFDGVNSSTFVVGSGWTEFASVAISSSLYAVGLYRYVQGGDTISLPAFSSASNNEYWGYSIYELGGVTGTWANDFQSVQTGAATSGTSITTTTGTTAQANTLAVVGMGQNLDDNGNSTAPTVSSGWAIDGIHSAGQMFGSSETFASKSSSVSTTITLPASATQGYGYIQALFGAAPGAGSGHTRPLLGVGN